MASELEEIRKLPPKLRLEKLREFEERLRKVLESESKNKEEAEQVLKKTIDELTKQEEEEEHDRKEKEKDGEKDESLEEIAEEEVDEEAKRAAEVHHEYEARAYTPNLSKRPNDELYQATIRLNDNLQQRGYLTKKEEEYAGILTDAFTQKDQSGYQPGADARVKADAAQRMLAERNDPLKIKEKYR